VYADRGNTKPPGRGNIKHTDRAEEMANVQAEGVACMYADRRNSKHTSKVNDKDAGRGRSIKAERKQAGRQTK
jgi:hypothetical protein